MKEVEVGDGCSDVFNLCSKDEFVDTVGDGPYYIPVKSFRLVTSCENCGGTSLCRICYVEQDAFLPNFVGGVDD